MFVFTKVWVSCLLNVVLYMCDHIMDYYYNFVMCAAKSLVMKGVTGFYVFLWGSSIQMIFIKCCILVRFILDALFEATLFISKKTFSL